MILDECPPYPCEREYAENSLALTQKWAVKAREWIEKHRPPGQRYFGIVQGACYPELREKAAGTSLTWILMDTQSGDSPSANRSPICSRPSMSPRRSCRKRNRAMPWASASPISSLNSFPGESTCSIVFSPTRVARNGTAYTPGGTINLKNAKWEKAGNYSLQTVKRTPFAKDLRRIPPPPHQKTRKSLVSGC